MKAFKIFCMGLLLLAVPACGEAAVQGHYVDYKDGDVLLSGYLAFDDSSEEKRPGVIVVHEWKGLGPYAIRRAEQLAEMGYIAFAIDMYGKGVRAETHEEAAKLSGVYRKDRELMRARAKAGFAVLREHPLTDKTRMAAIGYCFGGTTVLEMARSGLDLKGVVSFHGGLDSLHPEDARNIRAKVLVLHGADDHFTSDEQLAAFKKEMDDAGVDWKFVAYPGAVHSFTVKEAGDDPSDGAAYNAEADARSWEEMKALFKEIF